MAPASRGALGLSGLFADVCGPLPMDLEGAGSPRREAWLVTRYLSPRTSVLRGWDLGLLLYPQDIADVRIFLLNKCPPHGLVRRTKGATG